jgi:hypothetical protein
LTVAPPTRRVTLQVQATNTRPRFEVVADGQGICSHVGAALLGELSDRLGLTSELGRRANRGLRAGAHDRGQVLRDLVVMLADGGDCVSDLATLGDQPELFGQVCSAATAWRIVAQELPDDPRGIAALWSALARVREQAWALSAAPAGPLILDVDATLVDAHSDKQGAAPTYKQGFGFHPLGCWLDRGDGTGEALAGMLRPGNAGANTAADHLDVLAMALLGLPKQARRQPILVRADSAGATHALWPTSCVASCGFRSGSTSPSRSARQSWPCPSRHGSPPWTPTAGPAGAPGPPSLQAWSLPVPAGPRALGRSAAASDPTPARHTRWPPPTPRATASRCSSPTSPTLTLPCWRPATVPTLMWKTASAPPRQAACATCPSGALPPTMPGTLVMIAQTLVCWAQALLLDGDLAIAEPKALRYRLWHTAGRIVHHARRVIVGIDRAWPWADRLVTAFGRLRALPVLLNQRTSPDIAATTRRMPAMPACTGTTRQWSLA